MNRNLILLISLVLLANSLVLTASKKKVVRYAAYNKHGKHVYKKMVIKKHGHKNYYYKTKKHHKGTHKVRLVGSYGGNYVSHRSQSSKGTSSKMVISKRADIKDSNSNF
jgi:hypothetical protein